MKRIGWVFVIISVSALCACGGGGGGGGIVPAAATTPVAQSSPPGASQPTPTPSASGSPRPTSSPLQGPSPTPTPAATATAAATPTPVGQTPPPATQNVVLGGYSGDQTTYRTHNSGDAYEYSEEVAVTLPVATSASTFSYTITGSDGSTPPSSPYFVNYGKTVTLTLRKVPGVVYTLHISSPVNYTATFTSQANPAIPAPIRSTIGEPYRYGVLEHPFPFSLGAMTCTGPGGIGGICTLSASSLQQIQLLCNAHVRYVRIDYPAAQIMDNNQTIYAQPDFTKEDAIADALAQCGITEMPIILQYDAGGPMSDNKSSSLPMQFSSSNDPANTAHVPGYADFAQIVVQHLVQKYPQITRVELFNEPNNQGWGSFPVGGDYTYTERSGQEAAIYMKAAYSAIKSVAPNMTVVGPALADGGTTTDPRKFLPVMLANGCGPGTCYDVLSVHNYDWENPAIPKAQSYDNRWDIYKTLQQILAQSGYANVHVMLTEWGYSTDMDPQGFDPQVQALYLATGLNLMLADPTVDGVTYVNVYNSSGGFWGGTSLTNNDFSTKPGYNVFAQFASF